MITSKRPWDQGRLRWLTPTCRLLNINASPYGSTCAHCTIETATAKQAEHQKEEAKSPCKRQTTLTGVGMEDGGEVYYGGTLVLDVPMGALGTYEISFNMELNQTFLIDCDDIPIPVAEHVSALNTVRYVR